MNYKDWYEQKIHILKHRILNLQNHIKQLDKVQNKKDIFEYHIKNVKIEKVKGTLQIGQLVEQELIEDEVGIHRFIIDEVNIKEIEGTGTVGIGLTEKKSKEKHKKKEKISPEEADDKIKDIYDKVEELMDVKKVPEFFQKIAVKEKVLEEVYDHLNNHYQTSEPFNLFYSRANQLLHSINLQNEQIISQSNTTIDKEKCKDLQEELEEIVKTLLVVVFLLQGYLPGYLKNHSFKTLVKEVMPIEEPDQKMDADKIADAIKTTFNLKQLPSSVEKIKESQEAFRDVFYLIIHPAIQSNKVNKYLKDLNTFLQSVSEEKIDATFQIETLQSDELSFLYTHLLEELKTTSKYSVLIYFFYSPLCTLDY